MALKIQFFSQILIKFSYRRNPLKMGFEDFKNYKFYIQINFIFFNRKTTGVLIMSPDKEKVEQILKEKPNVINVLQDLQDEKGFLEHDDMLKLSKEHDIPTIDLYGVATFYSLFKLEKQGEHVIKVCSGTACHVKSSDKLTIELEKLLGIKRNETTEDGKFTLETVNCIGACARAPAMMIDDEVFGELTPKKLKAIIAKY